MTIEAHDTMSFDMNGFWLCLKAIFSKTNGPHSSEVSQASHAARNLEEKADKLAKDVDQLERELRKIGIRIVRHGDSDD